MHDYSAVIEKFKRSVAFITVAPLRGEFSYGTGFVFQKSGTIVTCNHVVLDPYKQIFVSFPDAEQGAFSEPIVATLVGRNIKNDIAILEYKDTAARDPLPVAKDDAREGMPIIFSGYPYGLKTLTTHHGIISSITQDQAGQQTYQIDGTVAQGNSGGPLMNENGEVVGVISTTRQEDRELLEKIEQAEPGYVSIQGIDVIEVYKSLIRNIQTGMGFAVPCSYIKNL